MKGKITLAIKKRVFTKSRKFNDKWKFYDQVVLISTKANFPRSRFKTYSMKRRYPSFIISKDEVAFVRFIFMLYGDGDYNIIMWGKGKQKGFRIFWDGIISIDRKFFRRRKSHDLSLNPHALMRETYSKHPENYVGRYMRTKYAGSWHGF